MTNPDALDRCYWSTELRHHFRAAFWLLTFGIGASLWTLSMTAVAAQERMVGAFTAGELALLPEWCVDTQAGPTQGEGPRKEHWKGIMGEDFWNMHHYCYALRDLRKARYEVLTPQAKRTLLEKAIGDLSYVVKTCASTMPLMPEVLLNLGDAYLMADDLVAASNAFESSRTIKPDYWPAYDHWIAVLMNLRQYNQARHLAEEGLKYAPGQPALQARLKEAKAQEGRSANRARAGALAP